MPCVCVSIGVASVHHSTTHLFRFGALDPSFHDVDVDFGPFIRLGPPGLVVLPDVWPEDCLSPSDVLVVVLLGRPVVRVGRALGIDDKGLLDRDDCDGPAAREEGGGAETVRPERPTAGVSVSALSL
jgi:hypothetical protein